MSYDAYRQFIVATKQFPRWTNIRRRPIESNGGKILRSIIEEIAEVEDAIIAYKKDFFIVNYIGREDEIIDYIYSVQVGNITDLDQFVCLDPALNVTDDINLFYTDRSYAYYENGYLIMYETNERNILSYSYNNNPYEWDIEEIHLWNVIDEFAWWCGLERFEGERNASLLQRSMYQLYYSVNTSTGKVDGETSRHPNSTELGIRNAIRNAAYAKIDVLDNEQDKIYIDQLKPEEIKFLEPNEENLALINDDGISLYEEISRFNRDIARTRQWDIDYWDNAFRQLYYTSHVWDAEVDIYKNGVGYMDSLLVSTAKDMNISGKTNVTVTGYANSTVNVESYIQSNNIKKDIPLTLTRYTEDIKPLSVSYRIIAEDILQVDPRNVYLDLYEHYIGEHEYYIDDLNPTYSSDITAEPGGILEPNKTYNLEFSSSDPNGLCTMEIERCDLVDGNNRTNKLIESGYFKLSDGRIKHTNVLIHATTSDAVTKPENIVTYRQGGLILSNALEEGSFSIPLGSALKTSSTFFIMPVESGSESITFIPTYVSYNVFVKNTSGYQSGSGSISPQENLTINGSYCRDITFDVISSDAGTACQVEIYVNNEKFTTVRQRANTQFALHDYLNIDQMNQLPNIKLVLTRKTEAQFVISNICRYAYKITLTVNGTNIPYKGNNTILPKNGQEDSVLICKINNYTATSPIVPYVHIGAQLAGVTYTISNISTSGMSNPYLDIKTNCKIKLINVTDNTVVTDYDTHTVYTNNSTNANSYVYLDLSDFSNIYSTVPATRKVSASGENWYTFNIAPNNSKKTVIIYGEGYKHIARRSLYDLIQHRNGDIYLSRAMKTCISKVNANYYLEPRINRIGIGDRCVVSCNDANISCCFMLNETDSILTNDYTGAFAYLYLYPSTTKQYIAYNTHDIITGTQDVAIVPSFLPSIRENALVTYQIDSVSPEDANVEFISGNKWSLNVNETVRISVPQYQDAINNPNIFNAEELVIHPTFLLSNTISLNNIADDTGNILNLSRYIITAPESVVVRMRDSVQDKVQQYYENGDAMYVMDTGFNKLEYSNINAITKITINGSTVNPSKYTLMPKEGIIKWNDTSLYGQRIQEIRYSYKIPDSLAIADLYDLVEYTIDAMKNVGSYTIENAEDKDIFTLAKTYFSENPNKIVIRCDNAYFRASINNDIITVTKIANESTPVIHNGYYYIDGKEYYFFADEYTQTEKRLDGVDMENADILSNVLITRQEAINYLKNSKMECNKLDVHCIVDFSYPRNRTNAEELQHIGACQSFAAWHTYNMSSSLTKYKNGFAISFNAKENGYALLDITEYLKEHKTISCLCSGNLTISLGRGIHILNEQPRKSIFCEKIAEFTRDGDIAYCIKDDIEPEDYRYFVIIEGSGILDEVLIHDGRSIKDIKAWHIKGIDKLGFVTEEKETVAKTIDIEYSSDFMAYVNLETGTDKFLRPGASVDWNITHILDVDLTDVRKQYFLQRNQVLIAQADSAWIESKPIEIRYRKSIRFMAFKLNDFVNGAFKGFTIQVLASSARNGTYEQIAEAKDSNIVTFSVKESHKYLKCHIIAMEGKIVKQISLFCVYREVADEDLSIFYNIEGSAVTKVFDTGVIANYKFKEILAEGTWREIWVRGARESMNGEIIWTSWRNILQEPDFSQCRLFQFKIIMDSSTQQVKINGFRFEVLADV